MEVFLAGLFAAIAFGTVWGWITLVAAYIIITALVENDKGVWAFIAVLTSIFLLCKMHLGDAFHFIIANPGKVALLVLGYFVVGTIWGIVKWFLYVNRELERYNEKKSTWLQNEKLKAIETSEQALEFKKFLGYSGVDIAPKARSHKSDIMLWMTYWPFSCLWTIINDPIRKIFRTIYANIAQSLQAISDRMFKGAVADLELAKEAEEAEKAKREEAAASARNNPRYNR